MVVYGYARLVGYDEDYNLVADLLADTGKLAACLEALAERERTVVVLTFFADKSGDEVARELGLTAGNVRVIRHRAIARLRGCMGGDAT